MLLRDVSKKINGSCGIIRTQNKAKINELSPVVGYPSTEQVAL